MSRSKESGEARSAETASAAGPAGPAASDGARGRRDRGDGQRDQGDGRDGRSPDAARRVPRWLADLARAVRTRPLSSIHRHFVPGEDARRAAVLILFGEDVHGPDVLLLERAADLRSHAGQPAFPGGGVDPGDPSIAATALREAKEEVGLDPSGVEVLTTASPLYLPPSRYLVTPVLAWWHTPCAVAPVDPAETSAVARVPIAELAEPANRLLLQHPSGFHGPAFRVRQMLVWGFTAAILDELLRLARWERPWDSRTPVTDPRITAAFRAAQPRLPQEAVPPSDDPSRSEDPAR